jgi:uncharacterized protein YprB with RNaseH-like and TPR domain
MQLNTQTYLDLVENAKKLVFFDIESTGLRGDYGSIICASFKPYNEPPMTVSIRQLGNDQRVVREIKEMLESFDCWCSYYGKGFDIPMIQTRLLKWGLEPVKSKHHIDLYFTLKTHLLMSRKSLAQMEGFLGTHQQKMGVSPNVWSEMGFNIEQHLPTMMERCETDVIGLENVYDRTRHLIKDIKIQS